MRILFVCLGNICRSPSAEAVMLKLAMEQGLKHLRIDSAGTSAHHAGEPADPRSQSAALTRGYDLSAIRSRPIKPEDFYEFDFILAMDEKNLSHLLEMKPNDSTAKVELLLKYATKPLKTKNVPDPYWSGADGFNLVLDLIEDACSEFLDMEIKC